MMFTVRGMFTVSPRVHPAFCRLGLYLLYVVIWRRFDVLLQYILSRLHGEETFVAERFVNATIYVCQSSRTLVNRRF